MEIAKSKIEKLRDYAKRWRKANPEKCKAYRQRWGEKNPEKLKEYDRTRYQRDHEKRLALSKSWNERNKVRKSANHKAWYWINRAKVLLDRYELADADFAALLARYEIGCVYCGEIGCPELDHRLPRSRGGDDSAGNLQWLCKRCNRAKSDLTEQEFFDHIKKLVLIRRQFEDCAAVACVGVK